MASKKKNTKRSAKATSTRRSSDSYAYSDRIPMIADVLRVDFNGSATVAELYKKLKTRSGEFNKERRVAATLRYDKRENGDHSIFKRDGKLVTLRSRKRSSASKLRKSSEQRKRTTKSSAK